MSLSASAASRRLTNAEKTQFRERGYVKSLPVFDVDAVAVMQQCFDELLGQLPEGTDINKVDCWHKANLWVYDLCATAEILDCVEDLIRETVTVWLVFYDTDDSNGLMRVVVGSHRTGMHEHSLVKSEKYVLAQGIDESSFDAADIVTIDLQAGQMSLHDDGLIHGSGAEYDRGMSRRTYDAPFTDEDDVRSVGVVQF